jgi:hypothetical protein
MILYEPELVVIKAEFVGFLREVQESEFCKHKTCGYEKGAFKCPKCGKIDKALGTRARWVYKDIWVCECGKYDKNCTPAIWKKGKKKRETMECDCGKDMVKKMGKICDHCKQFVNQLRRTGGKVKCQRRNTFTVLSSGEVSNPKEEIRYAAVYVKYYHGAETTGTWVIDLKTKKFEEGCWRASADYSQGASNPIYKRVYKVGPLETEKAVCSEDLVAAIWEKV